MKNTKHLKKEIILLYKRINFIADLFPSYFLENKELLLNDKTELPELCKPQQKKIKLSNCFVIETNKNDVKLKPRSVSTINPNSEYKNLRSNSNYEFENKNLASNNFNFKNNIKENEETNVSDYNNKRKFINFNEFFLCRENSISISNINLIEYNINQKVVDLNNDLGYLLNFKTGNRNENCNDKLIIKGRKFSRYTIT
jgi:hypothetical protein